ncbi:CpaF family protein [Halomonas sp. SpR8]|uniref:CpaF family protein n=1 Tax=Halomonas sp. SpR8 TaxID=3050463 RepID=UPI0027E4C7D6|nr:CpaF family protein [Halomonas sp. SpR8]MDQ7728163.1 CpaF family protein [Halomonas sp. SpR8]
MERHGLPQLGHLKERLHRYLIDQLGDETTNLIEGSRPELKRFIASHIQAFTRQHQLAISGYEIDRLTEEMLDELTGFGPLEVLLSDPTVTEILVNGSSRIFVERRGVLSLSDLHFVDDQHLQRVIQRIIAPLGRRLDESSPMVDARLPDGSRVNAVIPPIALDGASLSVRKFRKDMLKSQELIDAGSLNTDILAFLEHAVGQRCNIIISGGTGTGKTTMLNLLSSMIDYRERLVTIEDTAELQLKHGHVVRLETRPPNADGHGEITARNLVRNALRMRPDRIILGETRGAEVLDVLSAMNTGHEGSMTSIHANSAMDSLLRMETLVGLSGVQVPEKTMRQSISSALEVIIQLVRLPSGLRCISEVIELGEMSQGEYRTNVLFRYNRLRGEFVQESFHALNEKLEGALGAARGVEP